MKIIPEPIVFEWDKGNIDKNFKKHRITNKEAEEVFDNNIKFIFQDERHSTKEKRYAIFGQTNEGKQLAIVFTIRKQKVRIITARSMSKKEKGDYEEVKKNSII